MNERDMFIRQVRSRSTEHKEGFKLLFSNSNYGLCISTLRQELDSMVRVIYLLAAPLDRRMSLISATVQGEKWSRANSKGPVTDREMIELAQHLHGWTKSVYLFGCAYIHLSAMHDYNDRDPYLLLPANERAAILAHCRQYHNGPNVTEPTMADFIPYLPLIIDKVSGNLECYLKQLEKNEVSILHLI